MADKRVPISVLLGALEAAGVRVFGHPHFLDSGCSLYEGHPQNRHLLPLLRKVGRL